MVQRVTRVKKVKGGYEVTTPEGHSVKHRTRELAEMEKEIIESERQKINNNESYI